MSFKLAACLVGGFLFFVSGCSSFITVDSGATPVQVEIDSNPAPDNEDELVVAAVTPITSPNLASAPAAVLPATPPPPPTPTPLVAPMPIPTPDGPPYTYHTIVEGQTLSYIALLYNTTVEELVAMNNLEGPSALIKAGQLLRIPLRIKNESPVTPLLPDSEVVYGPGYVSFDIAEFVDSLDIPEGERERLKAMTPASYIGNAVQQAKNI